MKNIYTLGFGFIICMFLISSTSDSGNSFDARINTYKQECKQMIKPARYEASRITYYAPSKNEANQVKSVEAFFILDTEYKMAFSGKECSTKLNVRIYDSNSDKKTLLKELKNVQQKNMEVSSLELTKAFHKKVSKSERLKSVYVEYDIASGNMQLEAVVLVLGYID